MGGSSFLILGQGIMDLHLFAPRIAFYFGFHGCILLMGGPLGDPLLDFLCTFVLLFSFLRG